MKSLSELGQFIVVSITIILFSSCNPSEEIEQPPSQNNATSNLSKEQVRQMLQGSWYSYKRESVDGPTCAGGPNETQNVYTFDLQFSGFEIEFTNIDAGLDPTFELPSYQMYYGGGNGTTGYTILNYSEAQFFADWYDLTPTDFFLSFNVLFLEGYGYETGGKIVSITDDEFVLYTMAAFPTLVYFKRSNQTVPPYNDLLLSGNFLLDNYKEVSSGIVTLNEQILNGSQYSFTDQIYHDNNYQRVKYIGQRSGGVGSFYDLELDYFGSGDSFTYEVSNTHLFSEGLGAIWASYKVVNLDNQELVLRDHWNCNDYTEYHFTKVN